MVSRVDIGNLFFKGEQVFDSDIVTAENETIGNQRFSFDAQELRDYCESLEVKLRTQEALLAENEDQYASLVCQLDRLKMEILTANAANLKLETIVKAMRQERDEMLLENQNKTETLTEAKSKNQTLTCEREYLIEQLRIKSEEIQDITKDLRNVIIQNEDISYSLHNLERQSKEELESYNACTQTLENEIYQLKFELQSERMTRQTKAQNLKTLQLDLVENCVPISAQLGSNIFNPPNIAITQSNEENVLFAMEDPKLIVESEMSLEAELAMTNFWLPNTSSMLENISAKTAKPREQHVSVPAKRFWAQSYALQARKIFRIFCWISTLPLMICLALILFWTWIDFTRIEISLRVGRHFHLGIGAEDFLGC